MRRTPPKINTVIPTGVPVCEINLENELKPGQSGGIFFVLATNFTFSVYENKVLNIIIF